MITVWLDDFTPCLKDSLTGDLVETEVLRVQRTTFLKKFNSRNGWYVNWEDLSRNNEIYALVLEGTVDIQGLVALRPDNDMQSVFVSWMVAAPQNNRDLAEKQKYYGVGGHLFAIAIQKSVEYGFGGAITGFAASEELLKHYIKWFDATPIGILHPYHLAIAGEAARKVVETYDYRWSDDQL